MSNSHILSEYIKARKPYRAYNIVVRKSEIVEYGYLDVTVVTRLGDEPIEGATVILYTTERANGETILKSYITDENGKTEPIRLPVEYDIEDPTMDPVYYYTSYNLRVIADGYFSVHIINIQVFPNITVDFDINMTKIPEGVPSREETIDIPDI